MRMLIAIEKIDNQMKIVAHLQTVATEFWVKFLDCKF